MSSFNKQQYVDEFGLRFIVSDCIAQGALGIIIIIIIIITRFKDKLS